MIFVGIDQTGAVDRKGIPKPLPASFIRKNQIHFFYLAEFNEASLVRSLPEYSPQKIVIGIDCVMGLPESVDLTWRQALAKSLEVEGFGRNSAREFFQTLDNGKQPRRRVEILCKANSVFRERPYQKNIQTGTFRLWKEMAADPAWFYSPFIKYEKKRGRVPVYEGYPSLLWKNLLKTSKREPDQLERLLQRFEPQLTFADPPKPLLQRDPNLADALVLALGAKKFHPSKPSTLCNEGWIMGAGLN